MKRAEPEGSFQRKRGPAGPVGKRSGEGQAARGRRDREEAGRDLFAGVTTGRRGRSRAEWVRSRLNSHARRLRS